MGWFKWATAALLLLSWHEAHAEPLRPLRDALEQETSNHMMVYALKRCSALNIAAGALLIATNRPDLSDMTSKTIDSAIFFGEIANQFAKKIFPNLNDDAVVNDIEIITNLYNKEMDDYYMSTGNMYSELVLDDFSMCASLQEAYAGVQ